jgi:putative aminopeptidase FrvX
MINKDLLIKVLSIQSTVKEDKLINEFIEKYLSKIDGVSIEKDSFGNIYATKGSGENGYKCIVSHTDTVHQMCKNRKIYIFEDTLFAIAEKERTAYNQSDICQVGVGGDDKCGVYACLQAMSDFDNIKSVFFRFEETGCNGSSAANMKFFKDCNMVLQLDRKGSSDFITHTNGLTIASDKFKKDSSEIYTKYGFSPNYGTSTDVGALKRNGLEVSAANISSGYFEPHSGFETVNIKVLDNTYLMISDIFNTMGNTRYDHKKEVVTYIPSSRYALPAGKSKRKNKVLESNFFTRTLLKMNAVEVSGKEQSLMFEEILESGYYNLIRDEYIEVEKAVCPECGKIGDIAYMTYDNFTFCNEKECNAEIEDYGEIIKNIELEDNGTIYVLCRLYNRWIKKSDAVYVESIESYIKK